MGDQLKHLLCLLLLRWVKKMYWMKMEKKKERFVTCTFTSWHVLMSSPYKFMVSPLSILQLSDVILVCFISHYFVPTAKKLFIFFGCACVLLKMLTYSRFGLQPSHWLFVRLVQICNTYGVIPLFILSIHYPDLTIASNWCYRLLICWKCLKKRKKCSLLLRKSS